MIAGGIIGRVNINANAVPSSRPLGETNDMPVLSSGQFRRERGDGEEKKLDATFERRMAHHDHDHDDDDDDDDDEKSGGAPPPSATDGGEATKSGRHHQAPANGAQQQQQQQQQQLQQQQSPPQPQPQTRVERLPDMTGKVITVSAEETLKLTKDRKKKRVPAVASVAVEMEFRGLIAQKLPLSTNNDDDDDDDDDSLENAAGEGGGADRHPTTEEDGSCQPPPAIDDPPLLDPGEDNFGSIDGAAARRKSIHTIDTSKTFVKDGRRQSEFTVDSTETWSRTNPTASRRKSWENNTYLDLDTTLTGVSESAAISESAGISESAAVSESVQDNSIYSAYGRGGLAGNNANNINETADAARGGGGGVNHSRVGPHHHLFRSQSLRSSLKMKRGSNSDGNLGGDSSDAGGRPEYSRGITWGKLIDMNSSKGGGNNNKEKKRSPRPRPPPSSSSSSSQRRISFDGGEKRSPGAGGHHHHHHNTGDYSCCSSLTPDSRASGPSGSSQRSRRSGAGGYDYRRSGSRGSVESIASKRGNSVVESIVSKRSSGSGNTVSWKDESAVSVASTKDPEHVRRQSRERFGRGLHYAQRGNLDAARERFLTALRYRVMRCGPDHPDVAAVHEMLGHLNHLLGERAEDDDLDASLGKLDASSGHNDSMLGWDLGDEGGGARGNAHHRKAAMHFRTVLEILGKNHPLDGARPPARRTGKLNWKRLAETYVGLGDDDGDGEDSSGLEREKVAEIAARVEEKLRSLPVAAAMGGKKSSYATQSFLNS